VLVNAGARWLAVSSVDEGVTLRCAGLLQPRILVMGGFLPYEAAALVEHNLTPAIHALDQLPLTDELARRSGLPLAYHLKIDSGRHRMGTTAPAGDIIQAVRAAPHARLEGLMTHFASAADYATSQTDDQLAYFESLCSALAAAGCTPAYRHTSS